MSITTDKLSPSSFYKKDIQATQQSNPTGASWITRCYQYSAVFWFLSILVGQWLFFYFIMSFYGFSVINDNMEIWNRWEPLGSRPYHEGDATGNMMFAIHAIGAGIVAFGGALQLIPRLRTIAPRFHKINGYVYLLTVFFLAISGFYLSLIRGASPSSLAAIGTSLNGILILVFAYLTVKTAIKRDLNNHRKWAIRLFLVANAQWFLRVGVFSYLISGTTLGGNPAFGDVFFSVWTFACYLLPLAAAQLYFVAAHKRHHRLKIISATTLTVLTLFMLVGVLGLTPFLQLILSGEPVKL